MPSSSSKILISACLLGRPVRYDGQGKLLNHMIIKSWQEDKRLISICPEMAAGFLTPRPPCEIKNGLSGDDVLDGTASIVDINGRNETSQFILGAKLALSMALDNDCQYALLTENSPSCGSNFIYDGSFTGQKQAGNGVVSALLKRNGISVFSETEITKLAAIIGS